MIVFDDGDDQILNADLERYPDPKLDDRYILLDEIQKIPEWVGAKPYMRIW